MYSKTLRACFVLGACIFAFSHALWAQKTPVVTTLENPAFLNTPRGYSHVAKIDMGNAWMIIISGQVPLDRDGNLVGKGDFAAQTEFVYARLLEIVQYYGGNKDHIIRTGIFILDNKNIAPLREIRNRYINTEKPPTSTAVVVSSLFRDDILVEIEATAIIPKQS
jgi:enamine deaminase RidA (YjgF/YER057c/UK114 family)